MKYSKAIRTLREEMIISQEELAKLIGVSFATVNRWENGHFQPTIKTKRKLQKLFKKYGIKTGGNVDETND